MNDYTADLSILFSNESEFLKELSRVSKYMEKIKKYKNKIFVNEKNLYNLLVLDENISMCLEKLYVYSKFLVDLNMTDSKATNNHSKVIDLYLKYSAVASFIKPEILKKDFKYIKKLIEKDEKLKIYEINLKKIYNEKQHNLSDIEKKLLDSHASTFNSLTSSINKLLNVDSKFEKINEIQISFNGYEKLITSKDYEFNKNVYTSIIKKHNDIKHTCASLLDGIIKYNNSLSITKKYKSSLDMFLSKNDLDTKIYTDLIKYVGLNLKYFDKYWDLKKKILNLNDINIYDVNVPMINEYNANYSLDQARNTILSSLLVLGRDYCDVINKLFAEKKIDFKSKKNKKEIAYTTSSYENGSFVFLNYDNSYKSLSILSHELGHAAHFELSRAANNFNNYEPIIFISEIASQVNEILLDKHLIQMAKSKEEKLFYMEKNIQDFEFVVRKATMSAHFEKNIHEMSEKKQVLDPNLLDREYLKILNKYYNKNVILNSGAESFWINFSQMFGKYYVFGYATGYIIALLIAEEILSGNKDVIDKYLEVLKSGKSFTPNKIMSTLNIDLSNSKTYKKVFQIFEKNIIEFEKLYNSKEEKTNE